MGNKRVCGKCGGMFQARGFKMHETFCNGEKKEEHKTVEGEGSISRCHACGGSDVKNLDMLLKSGKDILIKNGKQAIEQGYTHFCDDCGEILK